MADCLEIYHSSGEGVIFDSNAQNDAVIMSLLNTSDDVVNFKMKTTDVNLISIKPVHGSLAPQETAMVKIRCKNPSEIWKRGSWERVSVHYTKEERACGGVSPSDEVESPASPSTAPAVLRYLVQFDPNVVQRRKFASIRNRAKELLTSVENIDNDIRKRKEELNELNAEYVQRMAQLEEAIAELENLKENARQSLE